MQPTPESRSPSLPFFCYWAASGFWLGQLRAQMNHWPIEAVAAALAGARSTPLPAAQHCIIHNNEDACFSSEEGIG